MSRQIILESGQLSAVSNQLEEEESHRAKEKKVIGYRSSVIGRGSATVPALIITSYELRMPRTARRIFLQNSSCHSPKGFYFFRCPKN
jgi:hypothetical protein